MTSFDDDGSGRRRRDMGIDAVLDAERQKWLGDATLIILANFPIGWEGLAEEFWTVVVQRIGPPHHPNVKGGLVYTLKRAGRFDHIGRDDQCRLATNHARNCRILRRLI